MAVIVTRAGKGSPLTNNEVDANFINLNTELGLKASAGANSDITSLAGITGGISTADYVQFDTTPETVPTTPGSLYWDSADGSQTLSLVMAGNQATQQIGEEIYFRVKASAAITNGQAVMFTGTVGASGALTAAPATGLTASTASYLMGIATQDIALNGWGYITNFGLVREVNTSAWAAGTILYYDPAVAGGLTSTIPTAPNAKVQVCAVIYQHASNGSLFVRPSFGGTLGQYEGDVNITSVTNGQVLQYDSTSGSWKNQTLVTLPSQTGNSGKFLTTNGTTASWATVDLSPYLTIASAASTYQPILVSGTSIKTVNSTSLLGSGDVAVQATLVSGTNIKTVNSTTLLGSGNVAVQATLVSGTNIKTVNGNSLLGSGDLAVSASPAGSNTQVQYNNGGAFGGSANLTFNGTNLTCGGTVTANSDESLKTNWRDLPTDFIEQLAQVKHGTYDRLDIDMTQDGVSAQSLQTLLVNSVLRGEDGKLSVAYGNAALVSAIQLAKRLVALEATVAKLVD